MKIRSILLILSGVLMIQSCSHDEQPDIRDLRFRDFQNKLAAIEDATERQNAADQFIQTVKSGGYPIFENDTTAVLLYQGDKDSVYILGDMGYWSDYIPMKRIAGTNLFYMRGVYEAQARLQYWIMFSKGGVWITDPLNPYKVLNGFGELSELAMPGYRRHPYFNDYISGKKGDCNLVEQVEISAGVLPYPHQLHVFLPPEYVQGQHSYPVVYFQDGIDYIEFAITPYVIRRLILDKKIEPVIAVFVTPPNRLKEGMPNRMTEYGLNDDYVSFFADQLVPFIDNKYRTKRDPQKRLVVGDSFGGLISVYIPFKRPDVFGMGYSQSGYVSFQKDKLINAYAAQNRKPIRLYVDVGTYERNVGAAFLPRNETDFFMANRRFKKVLEKKGYDFKYFEYFEGHTWGNWRRHLIDGLIHFFGCKSI